jgi:hypothetical protein
MVLAGERKLNKNKMALAKIASYFWLKPLTTIPISFLQLKLETIQN